MLNIWKLDLKLGLKTLVCSCAFANKRVIYPLGGAAQRGDVEPAGSVDVHEYQGLAFDGAHLSSCPEW